MNIRNKNISLLTITLTLFAQALMLYSDTSAVNRKALNKEIKTLINHEIKDSFNIENQIKGYYSNKEEIIGIVNNNDTIGIIEISSPSVVAIADKEYPWGWFQFPILGVSDEGVILVKWQMKNDSADEYGKGDGPNSSRISFDNGETWEIPSKNIDIPVYRDYANLPNGDKIAFITPKTEDISTLSKFPSPIYTEGDIKFFFERDLPDKFKGVYVNYFHDDTKTSFQANVDNVDLIRAAINNKLSTFWFGKLLAIENDIYACVYPSYYANDNGTINPIAISFYKSSNSGRSWSLQGKINYLTEREYYPNLGLNKKGFSEPTFEFLNDDRILCVMRTSEGRATPMYKAYSSDYGVTWSVPEPITPNGVMPQLVRLDNDILVMASGRPGIQLRVSLDGNGENWTVPIELIDFDEKQNWVDSTCGYPFLYKASDNELYLVYSDFKALNSKGESRKSIVFRKIKASRYSKNENPLPLRTKNGNRFEKNS